MASRRVHVSTACVPCRNGKTKCDGNSPACSSCLAKNRQCSYPADDDKRRLTLKAAVELLSSRVDQLCQFIRDNSLEPPSMPGDNRDALLRIMDYQRMPIALVEHAVGDPGTFSTSQPLPDTNVNTAQEIEINLGDTNNTTNPLIRNPLTSTIVGQDSLEPVWDWTARPRSHDAADLHIPLTAGDMALTEPLLYNTEEKKLQNPSTTETGPQLSKDSTEELVDKLSERVGSLQIGPGGYVRYYGPTSNFNLVKMPTVDASSAHRSTPSEATDCFRRLGLDKRIPVDLQDHLINLYFTWHDPALHVVDRAMFESAKTTLDEQKRAAFYSEALENAICAVGASLETRHHPKFVTFPRTLAEFFAERARAMIEIELDHPCIATTQALAVLSSHEVGANRDSRGWLYSGMAMRLAFALGLHVDAASHVEDGSMSQDEANLRRDVFWGAYIIDHTWSFYLGRPFRMNMEGATVAKPTPRIQSPEAWSPYTSPQSNAYSIDISCDIIELHSQRVQLADIMAPIAYALYGNLQIPRKELQEMNVEIVDRLWAWKDNLPPALQVQLDDTDYPYLPHVLLLHMQYHQNIVHAHRPYMSRTYAQPIPPQGPGSDHARMMCLDSASSIAKLLRLYEIRYEFRHMAVPAVGIVCSAALLLIFQNVTNYQCEDEEDVKPNLSACFRALEQFELSWESAKRTREFLLLIQKQWELRSREAQTDHGCENSQLRKRPRELHDVGSQELHDDAIFSLHGDEFGLQSGFDDWMSADFPFTMPPDILDRL